MTNFERIKNMNINEMAKWLSEEIPHGDCYGCRLCDVASGCREGWLKYLKSGTDFKVCEVDNDD